ncbi:hypothetical protein Btru_067792 [Bulinus truncatus]|nr:hypothetical protein Btru_067792 [Bulinus truncatus]
MSRHSLWAARLPPGVETLIVGCTPTSWCRNTHRGLHAYLLMSRHSLWAARLPPDVETHQLWAAVYLRYRNTHCGLHVYLLMSRHTHCGLHVYLLMSRHTHCGLLVYLLMSRHSLWAARLPPDVETPDVEILILGCTSTSWCRDTPIVGCTSTSWFINSTPAGLLDINVAEKGGSEKTGLINSETIDTDNVSIKKQVFEILSALCVYSREGYSRVLDILEFFKVR